MNATTPNGMPRWEYFDNLGEKHYGWLEKWYDHGGTDVTYQFRDEKTNDVALVHGLLLKKAKRIWS